MCDLEPSDLIGAHHISSYDGEH